MRCPKCGHEQEDAVRCAACGIYFEKWHDQQSLAKARLRAQAREEASEPRFGYGALTLTALLAGASVYWMMHRGAGRSGSTTPPPSKLLGRATDLPVLASPVQRAIANRAGNPIEDARNATVLIRTGWGFGSGF